MKNSWWVDPSQLDDAQKRVIALPLDGRYLVEGPPGSGKTNLLALRATYLHQAGRRNFIIVTFARALREFLSYGLGKYNVDKDLVMTHNKWAKNFLFTHGIEPNIVEEFKITRKNLEQQLLELVNSQSFIPYYDCVLLDEAHDYTDNELDIFSTCSKNLFLVADLNQRIYRDSLGNANRMKEITTKHEQLRYHYRNGVEICRLADLVSNNAEKLTETSNYNESENPSKVEYGKFQDTNDAITFLVAKIKDQLSVYPEENIGILCPTHKTLNELKTALISTELYGLCSFHDSGENIEFSDTSRIYCLTLHSAKGLEFRAAHMFGWDTIPNSLNRNMTYTAITRAKTSLMIYYFKKMNGYLDQALAQMNPRDSLPQINDLFPGS